MKVAQSCPTFCDYTVHGILQARILECATVSFCRGSSQPRDWTRVSHTAGGFLTSWATLSSGLPLSKLKPQATLETGSIPGSGRSPGGGMATHCSVPAWGTPWMEEAGEQGQLKQGCGCGCVAQLCQLCPVLPDPRDCSSPGSSVHGDSPGKNTGVGCHALLQGIFPTQGSNPGLPHCRQIRYCLTHQGSP